MIRVRLKSLRGNTEVIFCILRPPRKRATCVSCLFQQLPQCWKMQVAGRFRSNFWDIWLAHHYKPLSTGKKWTFFDEFLVKLSLSLIFGENTAQIYIKTFIDSWDFLKTKIQIDVAHGYPKKLLLPLPGRSASRHQRTPSEIQHMENRPLKVCLSIWHVRLWRLNDISVTALSQISCVSLYHVLIMSVFKHKYYYQKLFRFLRFSTQR